jgi:CxxC motif-containing protein (DUF1111 family)
MRYLAVVLICGLSLAGLVQPGDPIPGPGEAGAPVRTLSPTEEIRFLNGRRLFDKDFLTGDGVGPVFNGDSCRSCHQDPVVGGAGGIDVQVQRPMVDDGAGGFMSPVETGELAQTHSIPGTPREEIPANVVFVEERNSPTTLGLGLVELISEQAILANQDPNDTNPTDGIVGLAHILPGNVVGRLGWKANVPDLRSFVRDAMGNEMGITVPFNANNAFGFTVNDGDLVNDPELPQADLDDIVFFLQMLDFPPKRPATTQTQQGGAIFTTIGCNKCHTPLLDGVELYSNLLLHNVHPANFVGVTQGNATSGLYRTPPLRGLRDTAPYFHDGRTETIDEAIRRHDGEAVGVRQLYENNLSDTERAALLAFLESL